MNLVSKLVSSVLNGLAKVLVAQILQTLLSHFIRVHTLKLTSLRCRLVDLALE